MMEAIDPRKGTRSTGMEATTPDPPDPETLRELSRTELLHVAEAYGVQVQPGLDEQALQQALTDKLHGPETGSVP